MPDWVVVGVDAPDIFPSSEGPTQFKNRELILRAGQEDRYPDVSVLSQQGETYADTATFIHRFLSALSWKGKISLVTVGHTGGTHRTRIGGRPLRPAPSWASTNPRKNTFTFDSLPEPTSAEGELALALYREALGLNHETYKFLGFFKILNIRYNSGGDQIGWINQAIAHLQFPASGRVQDLQQSRADIGNYLYTEGRCAVAHAHQNPTVDPDKLDHTHKFNLDLIVIQGLAEYFIETELGISR